jgi:hypothetical protein
MDRIIGSRARRQAAIRLVFPALFGASARGARA